MPSHLINNQWIDGAGEAISGINPADGSIAWTGHAATASEIDDAVAHARGALPGWTAMGLSRRVDLMRAFAARLGAARDELLRAISISTGKPLWESGTEVDAMVNKVALSIEIEARRAAGSHSDTNGVRSATRYKPHGVCAVIGPFNFPGHLPNGHIVPALLAGNTVVYKPSELTPLVAEIHTRLLLEAGLPPGVFNLVHGGGAVGQHLSEHAGIDGIFFTGSRRVGVAIARANVERTGRILALEMGGDNPLVVHRASDLQAIAYAIIQSAFITAGQRCSCARRLILIESEASEILDGLVRMTSSIVVGPCTSTPEPFMGPVISTQIAGRARRTQDEFLSRGGRSVLRMRMLPPRGNFLSPGIVDVTDVDESMRRGCDELFAPLLQVVRVPDFDQAIAEANRTDYGLAAGLLSDVPALWGQFFTQIRAGVVNWNRPTTGASSALPFGGIGQSGNHRPSAAAAAEYCSYPVAVMESDVVSLPAKPSPGVSVQ